MNIQIIISSRRPVKRAPVVIQPIKVRKRSPYQPAVRPEMPAPLQPADIPLYTGGMESSDLRGFPPSFAPLTLPCLR